MSQSQSDHSLTPSMPKLDMSSHLKQLLKTEKYSAANSMQTMQTNKKKTNVMVFNPCKAWDFVPELSLDNQ